jgi:hypothetical protein
MRRLALAPLLLAACLDPAGTGADDLTSVDGAPYTIDFDAFVDVPAGASDAVVKDAIHRELKSALGALREQGIGLADRDAQRNLATMTLARTTMTVAGGAPVDRVRYHYTDTALVERSQIPSGPVDLTLLFGDYVARAGELIPICSDDQTTDADSLWYHYQPGLSSCRAAIRAEASAINSANAGLAPGQLSAADANRRFLATRATLVAQADAPEKFPEHDKLWGFAGDPSRTKIVVYSFFGVNADEHDPHDDGLVEYLRFERELRKRMPSLRVSWTAPQAMLLDFYVDGVKLDGVTWDDVERWVVDGAGWPASVGGDTRKQQQLLAEAQAAFSERWIVWTADFTATQHGVSRPMTIEIRTWHGWEDGSDDIRLHARWRYLEAFWNADVFSYTGHSHFGHGPLEPWEYSGANFPDRYQVMLINSCLSFNYYDEDFLAMHPGGSKQLDVVVNGLPAYWWGMGAATAAYVAGVTSGSQSWRQILAGMRVDLPWQQAYDPMRAVNGELDDEFAPTASAITVAPR